MTLSTSARGGVTIPRIWITVALSILLHALLLWQVNPERRKASDDAAVTPGEAKGPLNIVILPPPRPRAPPVVQRSEPAPPAPPPRPIPRQAPAPKAARPPPPPPPPVIARRTPAPEAPLRVPAERPAPPPAAPADDFAAALEARRRARAEALAAVPPAPPPAAPSAPPAESARERANRLAALNLGTNSKPSYGKRLPGGGVFQIEHRSYDYARYAFYGWNKDIRRDALQTIEVRKGNAPDIRVAIVRSMIDVIRRDYDEADFTWENRFGKVITLSARRRDQAGLEAYLLGEFFWDDRRPIGSP